MNLNHEPTLPIPDDAANEHLPPELEEQLQALVEEYEKRLRAEEDPDLYEFLAAHAALAAHLGPRLEAVEDLHRLTQTRLILGSTASAGEEDPPPDVIGRYRIKGMLGRGASAVVYQAYDPKFDRWVALKVLRDPAPGPDRATRFARNAHILARLRHPNIVPLHDTGEREGLRYLDMELIEGESLDVIGPEVRHLLPVGSPGDLSERSQRFSPDGRYLAWPGPDNTLMVADLPAVRAQVRAFEKSAGLR